MDFHENNKVSAFDALFCTNHTQMMKVLLPYTDNQTQKSLAVFIKFLELRYTIEFYQKHNHSLCDNSNSNTSVSGNAFSDGDLGNICNELLPFCTSEERSRLEQIRGLLKGIEMYQEMSRTMEMMKEFMPDMGDLFSEGSSNPQDVSNTTNMMTMLINMLTPEQKKIFTMLGSMNHDN